MAGSRLHRIVPGSMTMTAALAALSLLLSACESEWSASLDDVLRLNHIQVKGTHNSYHMAPYELYDEVMPEWDYTHAELDVQLGEQGVRQLEIDVYFDYELQVNRVLHVPIADPFSRCDLFTDCLEIVRRWSEENPWHLPIFLHIETKSVEMNPEAAEPMLAEVEEDFDEVFEREHLLTPDEVRGDHETLLEAVTESGWPTLGQVRGRIVPVLLDTREYRDFYTEDQTTTSGRLMFVTGTPGTPVGVTPKIDDPISDQDVIREEVGRGIIVRTRSDTPGNEALTGSTQRLEAALSSGAQIISTDYPVPVEGVDYVMEMPGVPHHRPGRCNPVTGPPECLDEALEP